MIYFCFVADPPYGGFFVGCILTLGMQLFLCRIVTLNGGDKNRMNRIALRPRPPCAQARERATSGLEYLPAAGVTGIGSLPHTDPVAAIAFVARQSPQIPFWPQLPQRGPQEYMANR